MLKLTHLSGGPYTLFGVTISSLNPEAEVSSTRLLLGYNGHNANKEASDMTQLRVLLDRGAIRADINGTISNTYTLNEAVEALDAVERVVHVPIVTSSTAQRLEGTAPLLANFGPLLILDFSANDLAWRQFKIPYHYLREAAFHVHWTKVDDLNEQGKEVRWTVEYSVFSGNGQIASGTPRLINLDGTYLSDHTTGDERIVYRTDDVPADGFVPGYYVSARIRIDTPEGTPMVSHPGLFSLDMTYIEARV